jgi:hypothetical protein
MLHVIFNGNWEQTSYFITRPSKNGNRPIFRNFFLIRDDRNVQQPSVNIIYYRHSPLKLNDISGSSGFTTNGFSIPAVAISAQNKLKLFQVTLDFSSSRVFQKLHSYGFLFFFYPQNLFTNPHHNTDNQSSVPKHKVAANLRQLSWNVTVKRNPNTTHDNR